MYYKSGTIIYRYVPVEIVDKIISKHGGINDETNN